MRWGARCLGVAMVVAAIPAAADDGHASPEGDLGPRPYGVLVPVVQGSDEVRKAYSARIHLALRDALQARGYRALTVRPAVDQLVTCSAPECVRAVLGGVGARFGLVPAIWALPGGRRELTLTLVGKSGRNLNAGTVVNGDLAGTASVLLDDLLAREVEFESNTESLLSLGGTEVRTTMRSQAAPAPSDSRRRANAWRAGPILLWAGGATTLVAIGAVIGMRDANQSTNKAAIAGWTVAAGAALAGGTAWWIIGQRRHGASDRATTEASLGVSPSGFDLRLDF